MTFTLGDVCLSSFCGLFDSIHVQWQHPCPWWDPWGWLDCHFIIDQEIRSPWKENGIRSRRLLLVHEYCSVLTNISVHVIARLLWDWHRKPPNIPILKSRFWWQWSPTMTAHEYTNGYQLPKKHSFGACQQAIHYRAFFMVNTLQVLWWGEGGIGRRKRCISTQMRPIHFNPKHLFGKETCSCSSLQDLTLTIANDSLLLLVFYQLYKVSYFRDMNTYRKIWLYIWT